MVFLMLQSPWGRNNKNHFGDLVIVSVSCIFIASD